MAHKEKLPSLPWELIEEILSRVPPLSLVRFKTVSKQFNTLLNNKTFINNHKATFRFIISTDFKIYSVSIDPKIEVRELTLDIPGSPYDMVGCNELMLCGKSKETLIWNPWLNQTRWFKPDVDQSKLKLYGIGYYNNDDNRRVYKTLAFYRNKELNPNKSVWKIGGFDSDVWNEMEAAGTTEEGEERSTLHSRSVSLDGSLYWVASYPNDSIFHVAHFDFSTEEFDDYYCDLPCGNSHDDDALVLNVFKEDRFSLLKQCHVSKKIEIWVTKNKIHKLYGEDVEWINFMEVSIPNLPYLQPDLASRLSYFVEDKRLVVCSTDENCRVWIYVFGENKFISKTQLDIGVDHDLWPLHCTYFPSLVSVPRSQREAMKLDV